MDIPGNFGRHQKCQCCNNLWNLNDQNDSQLSTDMGRINIACNSCMVDNKGYPGIDPDNFDLSTAPSDNFYLYSNGGWMDKNPIPNEYSSW